MPLLTLLCGCVEEAVLDVLDDPTSVTQADVQSDCVKLSSDLSRLCYYNDMQEQGFIIRTLVHDPNNQGEIISYYDTVRVTGDLSCTLEDDLSSAYEMEAFAYIHTPTLKIRSTTTRFKPQKGHKSEVNGMHIYPNAKCDATGYITVYGNHLSKIPFQAAMSISCATYGGKVEFLPDVCTRDSIRFAYHCFNIGRFDLKVSILGNRFDLPEPLCVTDASLETFDPLIYAGIPHLMDIHCKSGEVKEMCCVLDKETELTTRKDMTKDGQWHTVFMGEIGQTHKAQVPYTNSLGYDIYFPSMEVTYQNAWEPVCESMVFTPQCVIGGYGWSLWGDRNFYDEPVMLKRLDFKTGQITIINTPCKSDSDDVSDLTGYQGDYQAFGDPDGHKVYCASFLSLCSTGRDEYGQLIADKMALRVMEYDIDNGSWTHLFDLDAPFEYVNGYQTWAKVGDRIYFTNYLTGELGYWDCATGELWQGWVTDGQDYYNLYCGNDSENFYLQGNDMYAVSMSELSRKVIFPDFIFETFKTPEGETYGGTRVENGLICNGRLICTAPVSDYADRTYYGSTDGITGGALYPVGDEMYMIIDGNGIYDCGKLWHWKK